MSDAGVQRWRLQPLGSIEGGGGPSPLTDVELYSGGEAPGGSTFGNAVSRGTDSLQASLYGAANALGELTGIDSIATWGEEGVRRNLIEAALKPAKVENWEDVDSLAALGTKVVETVGEQVPQLAFMISGGLGGAALRGALAGIGKSAILNTTERAAIAGTAAATYPTHVGEMQNELKQAGINSPGTAFLTAVPNTALDVFGLERVLSSAFKGMPTEMAADLVKKTAAAYESKGLFRGTAEVAKALGGAAGRGAATGAAYEVPTETLQELINITARAYHDPEYDIFSPDAVSRLGNAAASAAVVGGALGGASHAGGLAFKMATAPKPEQPADQAPPADQVPPADQMPARPAPIGPSGTVKESIADLQQQINGYLRGERNIVFADRDPNDPELQQLASDNELIITPSPAGGVWLSTVKQEDLAMQAAAFERNATPEQVDALRARALGAPKPKTEVDPATARVRQTVGSDGQVIQEHVVDDTAPPPAPNQQDVAADTALNDRVQRLQAEEQGGRVMSLEEEKALRLAQLAAQDQNQTEILNDTQTDVIDSETPAPNPQEPQTIVLNPYLGPEGGKKRKRDDAKIVRDQQSRMLRALQALRGLMLGDVPGGGRRLVASAAVTVDEQGSPKLTYQPLPAGVADPDTSYVFFKALAEAARSGEIRDGEYLTIEIPNKNAANKKASPHRFSKKGLEKAGRFLRAQDSKAYDAEANLIAAVQWLRDHGAVVRGLKLDGTKEEANRSADRLFGKLVQGFEEGPFAEASRRWIGDKPLDPQTAGPYEIQQQEDALQFLKDLAAAQKERVDAGLMHGPKQSGISALDRLVMKATEQVIENQDPTNKTLRRALNEGQRFFGEGDFDNLFSAEARDNNTASDNLTVTGRGARTDARIEKAWSETRQPRPGQPAHIFASAFAAARTLKDRIAAVREYKRAFGSDTTAKLAVIAQKALASIKLGGIEWRITDQSGLEELAGMFERNDHNTKLIRQLLADKPTARILYLQHKGRVSPVIYIDNRLSTPARAKALLHELGHLVMEHTVQSMPEADIKTLREELGADPETFAENFANVFVAWAYDRKDIASTIHDTLGGAKSSRIIKGMVKVLRGLYRALRKEFGRAIPPSFNKWMDEWLEGTQVVNAFLPKEPETPFLNFTGVRRRLAEGRIERIAREIARRFGVLKKDILDPAHELLTQPLDSFLRANGFSWMADKFRHKPGVRVGRSKPTIDTRMRMEGARYFDMLHQIAESAPKFSGLFKRAPSPEWEQAQADLLAEREPTNEIGRRFRRLFDELHSFMVSKGVPLGRVKNYFPAIYSTVKLTKPGAYEQFKSSVRQGVERYNARLEAQAAQLQGADLEAARDALLSQRIEDVDNYIEALYNGLSQGDAAVPIEGSENFEIVSPGFGYRKKRQLPPEIRESLRDFREDDLMEVAWKYTNAAIRRGIWQEEFGLNDVLAEIDRRFRAASTAEEYADARAYRDAQIEHYQTEYGVSIYDPAAKLVVDLKEHAREHGTPDKVMKRILDVVIPAYTGRLGADMPPAAKRVTASLLLYQNLRVLSMGVLSQVMDLGLLMWRTKAPVGVAANLMKAAVSNATRKEMFDQARMIGAIRDDVTEHILNDQTGVESVYSSMRRVNEGFFKWNGMHVLTNALRATGVAIAKTMVQKLAEEGNADALAELGTDVAAVNAWVRDGRPMSYTEEHASVLGAINQVVDEAVLRPGAPTRPGWGNDQRWALLWHLKSFMWEYHTTVIPRLIADMKNADGAYKVMPLAMLGLATLPLAALGMEIRWLIAPPHRRPEGGWDYAWEVIRRSGFLGIGQVLADINEAENYGKTSFIAAMGPTASQIDEIIRKGASYNLQQALPFSPWFKAFDEHFGSSP